MNQSPEAELRMPYFAMRGCRALPSEMVAVVCMLQTRSNAIAWNPREAFNLTVANEDCCLYTYDIRKLQSATCVHKVCKTLTSAPAAGRA